MTYDGPLSILCDKHAIPILLCVGKYGHCTRTDIYNEVARQANTPKKIDALVDSGLLVLEPGAGRMASKVLLTDKGAHVVGLLHDMESVLSGQ